jgi:hypothetical protein
MRARRGGKPLDIDIAEFIREMREERDAQILDSLYGRRD